MPIFNVADLYPCKRIETELQEETTEDEVQTLNWEEQMPKTAKKEVEDVLEKIFIPFFTTKGEGSGIGLSLSRQIIRIHGGAISVKSKPNVETVFTLRF